MTTTEFTVLGFDFGLRRIGVAVGQTITGSANALETIHHTGKPDWTRIAQLIDEWKPAQLIVGLPLDKDDSEIEMTGAARKFGRQLNGRFNLPVNHVDERYSSIEAERIYAEQRSAGVRKRGEKAAVDAIAAGLIIETWLSERSE